MTNDALGIVARAFEAFSAGDFDAVASFYHPEGEIVGGSLMGPDTHFSGGPEALRQGVESARERWETFDVHATRIEPGGAPDVVLVRTDIFATARDVSVLSAWISWAVVTVRAGLIRSFRVFYTEQEARLAAGLPPRV